MGVKGKDILIFKKEKNAYFPSFSDCICILETAKFKSLVLVWLDDAFVWQVILCHKDVGDRAAGKLKAADDGDRGNGTRKKEDDGGSSQTHFRLLFFGWKRKENSMNPPCTIA